MKRQTKFGIVLAAAAVISVSVASLVCARGWVQQGADWYYADSSNEFVTETIQASGNSKFYLDADGRMVRDYFLEDYNGNAYYFGSNGAMVTNTWVAIDSALVENQDDYVPDNYWYYFQASGKAMKAASGSVKKTTVDGKKYAFNEYGQMCVGWFGTDGKTVNPDDESNPFAGDNVLYYGGGDNDGVLRAGWVTYYDGWDGDDEYMSDYTNLYFYFNTSNNKKEVNKTKKINGRTYAFNEQGIMMSGWDVYENPSDAGDANIGKVYFSGQDDGHQVKKGWVYAVPAEGIDKDAYNDDEEKYMYFNNSGEIVSDQFRKINGKYYVFNANGIMKTGLVVWANSRVLSGDKAWNSDKFVSTIDKDWATGEEYAKRGRLNLGKDDKGNFKYIYVDTQGVVIDKTSNVSSVRNGDALKIHLFGDDGARKTGMNTVEFTDDNYTLNTVGSSGDKGSGVFSKKYYSLGVLLKASADIRYGIYQTASGSSLKAQSLDESDKTERTSRWKNGLVNGNYLVLTTSGSKQKGNKTAKKDADGNYWMIGQADSSLKGIYTVGIKEDNSLSNFRTKTMVGQPFPIPEGQNSRTVFTEELAEEYPSLFVKDYVHEYIGGTHEVKDSEGNVTAIVHNVVWSVHNNPSSNESYYTCDYVGPCFQSDYGDGSNKWIPFGMLDNAYKSATFRFARKISDNEVIPESTDEAAMGYVKVPTNDYFLNCYWDVIR